MKVNKCKRGATFHFHKINRSSGLQRSGSKSSSKRGSGRSDSSRSKSAAVVRRVSGRPHPVGWFRFPTSMDLVHYASYLCILLSICLSCDYCDAASLLNSHPNPSLSSRDINHDPNQLTGNEILISEVADFRLTAQSSPESEPEGHDQRSVHQVHDEVFHSPPKTQQLAPTPVDVESPQPSTTLPLAEPPTRRTVGRCRKDSEEEMFDMLTDPDEYRKYLRPRNRQVVDVTLGVYMDSVVAVDEVSQVRI